MSSDDSDANKPKRPDKPPAPDPRPGRVAVHDAEETERERPGSGQQRLDDDSQ
jgi:hypothetical protein